MQITKENWEETALTAIRDNPVLAKLYKENAHVGASNLSSDMPLLKIQAMGRSQKNILADGKEAADGYFYYKPTKEQFQEVTCHILTISKGFRADGYKEKKDVFNQILSGVIVNEGKFLPFMMYFTGSKLQNLWQFGKDASLYTRAGVPLFVLRVKFTSEKITHDYGTSWVVKFEIMKDEKGSPLMITDDKYFLKLRDSVAKVEASIDELIASKVTEDQVQSPSAPIPDDPMSL